MLTSVPTYAADETGAPIEACSTIDPETMFPDEGLPNDHEDVLAAKQVCRGCYFRSACLSAALARNEQWGVWGGLSEKERQAMKRKHRRHTAAQAETLLEVAG